MQAAVHIFNVLNPMIMRKTSPRGIAVAHFFKLLAGAIRSFFKSTHDREFNRLKDFISS
jgi:hypothetical protein